VSKSLVRADRREIDSKKASIAALDGPQPTLPVIPTDLTARLLRPPEPTRVALLKINVNVDATIGERLRRTAFEHRLSESIIVELALKDLYENRTEEEVATSLIARGAKRRRYK
jgi:hypothetical protein